MSWTKVRMSPNSFMPESEPACTLWRGCCCGLERSTYPCLSISTFETTQGELKTSMTVGLPKNAKKSALEAFKLIQTYMGDRLQRKDVWLYSSHLAAYWNTEQSQWLTRPSASKHALLRPGPLTAGNSA
jgi:hypothetical protein